jgi:hypothetical protein
MVARPFIAANALQSAGQVVGNGQCVALVRDACSAPHTSNWTRGERVRDNPGLKMGTAIATFDPDGHYGNHVDGRSHAAILLAVTPEGLLVNDQWLGQTTHTRLIHYRGGKGDPVNDGDAFYVVMVNA